MKNYNPKVLYFSLEKEHITEFWQWVETKKCRYCPHSIFTRAEDANEFQHTADLSLYLNQHDCNLQSLHVIIDIASITEIDQIKYIRNSIVEFPEVQFLFDTHYRTECRILDFIFPKEEYDKLLDSCKNDKVDVDSAWKNVLTGVDSSFLEVNLNNPKQEDNISALFSRIINGMDNTFDVSNLRYAIKYWKYIDLKVYNNRNFSHTQDSRFENIAICIEEEVRQNIFTSYALYANGFRSLPITTRLELWLINSQNNLKQGIIIRDYDLQFEDEDGCPVDAIRGYRYCKEAELKEGSALWQQVKRFIKDFKVGWNDLTQKYLREPNVYWGNLISSKLPIYFITKGPRHSIVAHPDECNKVNIDETNQVITLPGFEKPICGIYRPFHALPKVREIYQKTRYSQNSLDYEIKTYRKDHDHSTPLDIYDLANNMIRRADNYYSSGNYILAALVSSEALEFLNGFHYRLMVKAYYIHAIAENAIAMNIVGGNEAYLAKDTMDRVKKIKEDVERIFYKYDEKNKRYVLNQIYSSCRQFCKAHEHFESEEIFISALGHLLEGLSPCSLIKNIKNGINKVTTKFRTK